MRVALCSDIHLEFGPIELTNEQNADVLILSGDIITAHDLHFDDVNQLLPDTRSDKYHKFFQRCCEQFPHVVYIMGNHEHYHGDFAVTAINIRERLAYLSNLHFLDKETFELDDCVFIGGTLWTDMNKEDPITLSHIRGVMNDYRRVTDTTTMVTYKVWESKDKPVGMTDEEWLALPYEERQVPRFKERAGQFTPQKSVEDHKAMLSLIDQVYNTTATSKYFVVVGHHAPSKLSIKPQYAGEHIINGAYSSDLSEFILDHPRIKLWTHGHTHDVYDYMIGSTRIACNPRGYIGYEQRADDFELMYIDL